LKRSTPWRSASADEKFLHAVKVAHAHDGIFFSVNLSLRQQRRTANAADPVRALARKLQRAFQGLGLIVPPFALVVETSPSGRTHAHGVLIHGHLSRDRLVAALMKFGGKITGRAASRQVGYKLIYDAAGARGYMFADADHTRRQLDIERVSYLSDDLRRLTRSAWEGTAQ
jgi:hypothetical protein